MKTLSSMWNFGRASKDSNSMEITQRKDQMKAHGENQTKSIRRGKAYDVQYFEPNENSNQTDIKRVPNDGIDVIHKVSLLKENGIAKFNNNDFGGALADFNAANKIEPQCVSVLKYRAAIKRALGQYHEAMEDLNLANGIEPNNLFILATRGTVKKELKYYEGALKDLDRANEIDDKNAFVKTQRGVVKRNLRDFEGALVDFNEANALQPNQAFVFKQLGVVMRELGKFNEGLSYFDLALKCDSSDPFIYQQRGVVRRELKDLEGALDDLNKANNIMSNDSYTLRRRGVTRRELLDFNGSLEDLNLAIMLEPYNELTFNERGVTKKSLGDFQGALEDLTMANCIKSGQAFTLKHRGSANRQLGNLVEALHDLTCANQLEPNDCFILLELAMTKILNHDYRGALIHYNQVLKMKSNDYLIFQQRSSVRRILQDYVGALQDLNKADELRAKIHCNTLASTMERCFIKYAMKDVTCALKDAKIVRNLLGEYDHSSIKGDQLKLAINQSERPSQNASSISQKLNDIEVSTSSRPLLWIDDQDLLFSKVLGKGSFGYVQKCKWISKKKDVAVKYFSPYIKEAFEYEVRMLIKIQHPLVVRLIGCSYNKEEEKGLVVMELMECNLENLINKKKRKSSPPFDLEVAVDIMKQIAEAMEYLHQQGVLHRDLKSSNVLVNSYGKGEEGKEKYIVKIADFGMAKLQANNKMPYFMTVDVGTTFWRAPEVFKKEGCQKYSFPADVWSYGMTCYEILSGEQPFEGFSCAQIRAQISSGIQPKLPTSCSGFLQVLLIKCWSLIPHDRPSFSNINKFLKLYLETLTFGDSSKFRTGDAIQPHEFRKFSM